jgi:hypothetical protein
MTTSSLIMFMVTYFKSYNCEYGHLGCEQYYMYKEKREGVSLGHILGNVVLLDKYFHNKS